MSEPNRRIEVFYTGHVQGVGFRYRTHRIAGQFTLGGFVRNLDDGRVQVVAEGAKDELLSFLREIDHQMGPYIRDKKVVWGDALRQFGGFQIRA